VLAARQLGIAEIPVMVAAGWTEAQKRAYVLADNQLAITGSGWDPELLRLELGELKLTGFDLTLTGFNDLELGSLLADKTEGLTDPDDAPAVPEHPVSVAGDLWLLGRHRLLCGDSTVATDVERVLGGVAPPGRCSPATSRMSGTARCTSARSRNLCWPPGSWSAAT
jgi:ParB-like chromosome segregation protein Spo0J